MLVDLNANVCQVIFRFNLSFRFNYEFFFKDSLRQKVPLVLMDALILMSVRLVLIFVTEVAFR